MLMAATRNDGRSLVDRLERGVIYAIIFGVLAFACAFTVVAFLGLAVYSAALPDYGPVKASCLAALGAVVLMGVLLIGVRGLMRADKPEPPRPAALPGVPAGMPLEQPKSIWDVIALVAAGVLTGLAQRRAGH